MAAIRLSLGDKKLPPTVATNTKIADTLVFAQFKCDQSMDIFLLLLIVEGREKAPALEALYALQPNSMAASSSSIDEWTNEGLSSASDRHSGRGAGPLWQRRALKRKNPAINDNMKLGAP